MKYLNYLLAPLTLAASVAYAADSLPAKQVNIPFGNQKINVKKGYEGLYFTYSSSEDHKTARMVVCTLSNTYKSWIDSPGQSLPGVFGGTQTVILTHKGPTKFISEAVQQYHVNASGTAVIHDIENNGSAACHYESDPNNNK